MTATNIIKTILISIITITVIYFVIDYSNTRNKLNELKYENLIKVQNLKAYQDSIKMTKSVIQEYTIKVENLNTQLKDKSKSYTILQSKYKIIFDSLQILSGSAWVDFIDSNHITISFNGNKKKIHYNGNVIYSIDNKTATHSITIAIDPISIQNLIYVDSLGTLKSKIYADSVLIDNASTTFDESVYKLVSSSKSNTPYSQPYTGIWSRIYLGSSILFVNNEAQLNILGEYAFNNFISVIGKYEMLKKNIQVEVMYKYSLYNYYKLIF